MHISSIFHLFFLFFSSFIICYAKDSIYILSDIGQSCFDACFNRAMNCNLKVRTNNSYDIFIKLGLHCDVLSKNWTAQYEPMFIPSSAPNKGVCAGFTNVPAGTECGAAHASARRVCRCDPPSTSPKAFGTGLSQGVLTAQPQTIFTWVLPPPSPSQPHPHAALTHWWMTASQEAVASAWFALYIDGEPNASITFQPGMAGGVGFNDPQAPWGTKNFGKGAASGGYFLNFRIPFTRSVRATAWLGRGTSPNPPAPPTSAGFYTIIRGAPHVPISIGGITLPVGARLVLQRRAARLSPFQFYTVADVPPTYSGLFFMHTLAVQSTDLNFLEGCYHMYADDDYSPAPSEGPDPQFPGTVLSTGTEDFFDSAWYFDAGEFHMPVSGFTHMNISGDMPHPGAHTVGVQGPAPRQVVTWSAYRFQERDPLPFSSGFRLEWRNGDLVSGGRKCLTLHPTHGVMAAVRVPDTDTGVRCGTAPARCPGGVRFVRREVPITDRLIGFGHADVQSYAWIYIWSNGGPKAYS